MAKEGEFGGFPKDELEKLLKNWASTAQGSFSDTDWIKELVKKVKVLEALVREEHAAANASDTVDIVAVVMKCVTVREIDRDIVGGGSAASDLVDAIGDLEKAWGG